MDSNALKRAVEEYYNGDVTCEVVIEDDWAKVTVSHAPNPVTIEANLTGSVASVGARFAYIIDLIDRARKKSEPCP